MDKYINLYITLLIFLKYVNGKSIPVEEENKEINENNSFIFLTPILCIGGVLAIVVSGGFCMFSKKTNGRRNSSKVQLNPDSSEPNTTNTSSSSSSSSSVNELRKLNCINEEEDITDNKNRNSNDKYTLKEIKVQQQQEATTAADTSNNNNNGDVDDENNENSKPKRRSFLGITLPSKNSKNKLKANNNGSSVASSHRNSYQIQIVDDRSINSISTNEDWINEQKYHAHMRALEASERENGDGENNFDGDETDDGEEDDNASNISNDGFWTSELEPIQSSSNTKEESYAVPSLGRKSTMIIKSGGSGVEQSSSTKRHSVILLDDENGNFLHRPDNHNHELDINEEEENPRPTRVTSWKDKDLNKEILEILRGLDDEDKKREEEEEEEKQKQLIRQKEQDQEQQDQDQDQKQLA